MTAQDRRIVDGRCTDCGARAPQGIHPRVTIAEPEWVKRAKEQRLSTWARWTGAR